MYTNNLDTTYSTLLFYLSRILTDDNLLPAAVVVVGEACLSLDRSRCQSTYPAIVLWDNSTSENIPSIFPVKFGPHSCDHGKG